MEQPETNEAEKRASGSLERVVSRRKSQLPMEVREILKEAARYEKALLKKAGWCKDCMKEKHGDGGVCDACREKRRAYAEKRNRKNGHKSWEQRRAEAANKVI